MSYSMPTSRARRCGFSCIHRLVQSSPRSILEHFPHPKEKPALINRNVLQPSLPASPPQPRICILSPWIYLCCTFHINGNLQYVVLCVWLLSFCILFLKVHPCWGSTSTAFLLLPNNSPWWGHATLSIYGLMRYGILGRKGHGRSSSATLSFTKEKGSTKRGGDLLKVTQPDWET